MDASPRPYHPVDHEADVIVTGIAIQEFRHRGVELKKGTRCSSNLMTIDELHDGYLKVLDLMGVPAGDAVSLEVSGPAMESVRITVPAALVSIRAELAALPARGRNYPQF